MRPTPIAMAIAAFAATAQAQPPSGDQPAVPQLALKLPTAALYAVPAAGPDRNSPLDRGSPTFDARGTAYLRDGAAFVVVPRGGSAKTLDLGAIAATAIDRDLFAGHGRWDAKWDMGFQVDTGIAIDGAGRLYTLIVPRYSNLATAVMLWSADGAATWHAVALTGRDAMLEMRDGFNDVSGPPTVVSFDYYGALQGKNLWLEPFAFAGGTVARAGPAMLVSDRNQLGPKHSGCANVTFTTPTKIFVVYPVVGPPGQGTAQFGRQYDRRTGRFEGNEVSFGRSLTVKGPDAHDEPGITADARGTLSVLVPGHQVLMLMTASRKPWSMLDGWTAPESVGQPRAGNRFGHYTYPTLNTARDGTVNIVARAEGNGNVFRLVQLRRPRGGPWTIWPSGTVERDIAVPNRNYYVAWRQRMTMSPSGELALSFRYFPDQLLPAEIAQLGITATPNSCDPNNGRCWFNSLPDMAPTTLLSADRGATWQRP